MNALARRFIPWTFALAVAGVGAQTTAPAPTPAVQEPPPAAVRIGQIAIDRNWDALQGVLPQLKGRLAVEINRAGVTPPAAEAFNIEFAAGLTKDNLARVLARSIAQKLTPEEQAQTVVFLESSAGAKYSDAMAGTESSLIMPMVKDACRKARAKVPEADGVSLRCPAN